MAKLSGTEDLWNQFVHDDMQMPFVEVLIKIEKKTWGKILFAQLGALILSFFLTVKLRLHCSTSWLLPHLLFILNECPF